jgi:hypothetical protein
VKIYARIGVMKLYILQESKKHKNFTAAELYFVPFDRANLSELFPLKFMDDRETPIQFHLLDGLEVGNLFYFYTKSLFL